MARRVRDTINGTLRPNDPRRFLVEAMLGAMSADGKVHDEELKVMHRHIDEHELFSGLSEANQKVLLDLARDAVLFAGNSVARIPAIAAGLPGRLYRITAVSLACEIVVADTAIEATERNYLDTLRRALRIIPQEFEEIFAAAREHRSSRDLDARLLRIRELVPHAVEIVALRSLTLANLTPEHRRHTADLLGSFHDLALRQEELDKLVDAAFGRMHFSLDVETVLRRVAERVPDPIDRYWLTVYVMCTDIHAAPHWRAHEYYACLLRAFEISADDIDRAARDAAALTAALARA
ncbi:MAG: tellurite resistance TerB family protein [Myxococcales bacterium]|nr:tellurite resistance TerB family protein [Myxococcales bacterium]